MPQEVLNSWVKRGQRRDVELPAILYREGDSKIAVVVSNISYDGCRIRSGQVLQPGECFTLVLPKLGEIGAQVQWSSPQDAGARFITNDPGSQGTAN